MKPAFKYILLTAIVFLQVSISKAQNRILSLEDGISLLGISENQINSIVNRAGYSFDNRSDNIIAYSKYIDDGKYYLTIVYKNLKVSDISWTENGDYLPMYNNEIVANMGFVKDKEFDTGQAHVFNYKSYTKNLTVSFIWRYNDDKSHFVVTIGKINYGTKTQHDLTSNEQNSSARDKSNTTIDINWSKLKKRKFLVGYLVSAGAYQKLVEKFLSYNVEFFDPFLSPNDTVTSIDNRQVGMIRITDSKTNKMFKKYYIIFDKMVVVKYTLSSSYKIQNVDGSNDIITLDLCRWNKANVIKNVPFTYSITIETLSHDDKKTNQMSLWCNAVK
ncbi:MAG TPA: hypothetical protein VFE53_09455 [Mucilaginibacter sp.]|jgi:hypothetical protein|nr:hypothetical protein [Mucilaginibacter sp.]